MQEVMSLLAHYGLAFVFLNVFLVQAGVPVPAVPTLMVAGVSFLWGPHPAFDAAVAISVGVLLGLMAIFLAAINRRLLIDSSDPGLDRAAECFLAEKGLRAKVSSILVDDDRGVLFVHVPQAHAHERAIESHALGEALKAHALAHEGKTVDAVYWQFPA